MSRDSRNEKLRLRLEAAEEEFRELLISSLQKCKDGSCGVFLTEAKARRKGDIYPRLVWPEAKQLESLGKEIRSLREQLKQPMEDTLYAKYQEYCAREGPNELAGKKLAAQFLTEIGRKA